MYHVNSKIQTIVKRLPLMAAILGAGLAMAGNKIERINRSHADPDGLYTFEYSGDYSATSVQNRTNWSISNPNLCDGEQGKACKIRVHAAYVDSTSGFALKPTFSISSSSSGSASYVSGISDASGVISNQLD